MRITFLTPHLPPTTCGVADHTVELARALQSQGNQLTAIHVDRNEPQPGLPFDHVHRWDRDPASLQRLLDLHRPDCLWLQYSGYGYARHGIPGYLPRALARVRKRTTIAVYFHETHCVPSQLGLKGPVLAPWQRAIGRRLAHAAHVVLTNCDLHREIIARDYRIPRSAINILPLGSNIPIPVMTADERAALRADLGWSPLEVVAVTFGSGASQLRSLERHLQTLRRAMSDGLIHRVVCVGDLANSSSDLLETFGERLNNRLNVLGRQPAERIAEILLAADVAFTVYPAERFGKSGGVAAYAAAGLLLLSDGVNVQQTVVSPLNDPIIPPVLSLNELSTFIATTYSRTGRQRAAAGALSWNALATRASMILTPYNHSQIDPGTKPPHLTSAALPN